ncbi:hypothetical protein KKC91_01130 [bacterium]|nr:hypothetical protein [bacterium]
MDEYLNRNINMAFCPSEPSSVRLNSVDPSYICNYHVFRVRTQPPNRKLGKVRDSCSTFMICDEIDGQLNGGFSKTDYTTRIGDRHNDGFNSLFVDGHVEWWRKCDIKLTNIYGSQSELDDLL